MDHAKRIAQFEKLVAEDPGNDMAHFSLGGAYAQAGRHADAARAYVRAVEVNEGLSKAYQLAGASYVAAERPEEAAEILRRGYVVAAARGDLMPQKAIGEWLDRIGVERPAVESGPGGGGGGSMSTGSGGGGGGGFVCARTGRAGTRMARQPFRGGLGAWIGANIAEETFKEWIGLGTKIINELKLDLSNDDHAAVYDYGMRRYLGVSDGQYAELMNGQTPPRASAEYQGVIDQIIGRMGDLESFQGKLDQRVSGG